MYKNRKRNQALLVLISVIIFVTVSTTQLTSMLSLNVNPSTANHVYAKYSNDQAQSLVNECGIGDPTGVNCGINSPQAQAGGTASTPMNFQISGGGEEGPPGPPGPPGTPGAEGPAGPPGPDKELQVRQVVSDFVEVIPGALERATANCDEDEVLIGGSGRVLETESPVENVLNPDHADGPQSPPANGWEVVYTNPGPESISIRAFAECAKLVDVP